VERVPAGGSSEHVVERQNIDSRLRRGQARGPLPERPARAAPAAQQWADGPHARFASRSAADGGRRGGMVAGLGTLYVRLRRLSLTPFPRALFGMDEKDGVRQDTADTDKADAPTEMARGLVEC